MEAFKKALAISVFVIFLVLLSFSAPAKQRVVVVEGDIVKIFEFKPQTQKFDLVWESAETGTRIKSKDFGIRGIALEDTDGDGRNELIAIDQFGIFVWGKHGRVPAYYSLGAAAPQKTDSYVLPLDLDGDGRSELITQRREDLSSRTRKLEAWKIDGAMLVRKGEMVFPHPISYSPRLGDCDNDKIEDIITSDDLIHIVGWEETKGFYEKARFPNNSTQIDVVRIADVNGDGKNEIVASGNGGCFTVYAVRESIFSGAIFYPVIYQSEYLGSYTQGLEIADIDGDGKQEILVGVSSGRGQNNDNIFVFKQTNEESLAGRTTHLGFKKDFSMPLESSDVPGFEAGDADNDGRDEVVFNNKHVLKFRRDEKGNLQCDLMATLAGEASASLIGEFTPTGQDERTAERIIPRDLHIDLESDGALESGKIYHIWAEIISPWDKSRNVRVSLESDTDKIKVLRGQILLPALNAGVIYDHKSDPFAIAASNNSERIDFVLALHITNEAGYSITQVFNTVRSSDDKNFRLTIVPNIVVTSNTLAFSSDGDIFKDYGFPHDYLDSFYGTARWPEVDTLLKYYKLLISSELGDTVLLQQKNKLRAFLDKDGRVLLHGNEALTISARDEKADEDTRQFAETYFRARSLKRFEGKGKIQGQAGNVITDGLSFLLVDRATSIGQPSILEALPGAVPILFYPTGEVAAVCVENKYKIVCLGFNISAIQDEGIRKELVRRILAWFDLK